MDPSDALKAGGSGGAFFLALYLVRKLGKRCRLTKNEETRSTGNRREELELWDSGRSRRTVDLVISLVGLREGSVASAVGIVIFMRSLCDLQMVHLMTAVESALISGNARAFRDSLFDFCGFMMPVSALNAMLNYLVNELALCLRTKLTERLMKKYTSGNTFFEMSTNNHNAVQSFSSSSSPSSSSAPSATQEAWEQLLTHDVEEFTSALANLFSHLVKPSVDVLIFSERLWKCFGWRSPTSMVSYLVASSFLLGALRSPAGLFACGEMHLEGEFRAAVARLTTNAEQIASLSGGAAELTYIMDKFYSLIDYSRLYCRFRGCMSVVDGVMTKYSLTALGWVVLSSSFLDKEVASGGSSNEEVYRQYHTVSKMMMNLSSAIGTLILSSKDFVRCFGMGSRIVDFEEKLDACLEAAEAAAVAENDSLSSSISTPLGLRATPPCSPTRQASSSSSTTSPCLSSPNSRGRNEKMPSIELIDVQIQTPNGEVLIPSLSLSLCRYTNLLVTGPNGTGKSSFMRTIAGLWPVTSGTLRKCKDIYYLPQKPYMPVGSLRDAITYPYKGAKSLQSPLPPQTPFTAPLVVSQPEQYEEEEDVGMSSKALIDAELVALLDRVQLRNLLQRGGVYGLDVVENWSDVLSGGEKQRLSMCRMFFHRPSFALLDESTSAVNESMEESLFQACADMAITLITVSHRPNLRKFHDAELRFHSEGKYSIHQLN